MSEIVEFLRARIDEDEKIARSRSRDEPIHLSGCYYYNYSLDANWFCDCDEDGHATARLLAECAAKRAIVEACKGKRYTIPYDPSADPRISYRFSGSSELVEVLRDGRHEEFISNDEHLSRVGAVLQPPKTELLALAAIYKGHPDYRPEWAA